MLASQDPSRLLDSILHLRTSPLFGEFSATQLTPLAYHAREVRFPAGAVVAHQAEVWNQLFYARARARSRVYPRPWAVSPSSREVGCPSK
jgi:hypothetical protein